MQDTATVAPAPDILPLSRALREWFPPTRTNGATNPATAFRWNRDGCRTPDGGRVHLRITRIGGRLYLRRADVEEFIRACSAEAPPAPLASPSPAPEARQARAAEVLARAGLVPGLTVAPDGTRTLVVTAAQIVRAGVGRCAADPAQAPLDKPAGKRARGRKARR